jgi:hypothetical protein
LSRKFLWAKRRNNYLTSVALAPFKFCNAVQQLTKSKTVSISNYLIKHHNKTKTLFRGFGLSLIFKMFLDRIQTFWFLDIGFGLTWILDIFFYWILDCKNSLHVFHEATDCILKISESDT